jgi:hypothetical protein
MIALEHRIYVNNKLVNICNSDYAYMCNLTRYQDKHGKENVTVKDFEKTLMDKEKREWLNSL